MLAGPDGEQAEHSYLAGGTIAPVVVARLFKAARLLFRTTPWRHVEEYHVVRVVTHIRRSSICRRQARPSSCYR